MKICLLGAQGTGKSTLVNLFKDTCRVVDGIARNVIAHGGTGNQEGNAHTQRRIFKDYCEALKGDYLSTRSMIDVYAYTRYLEQHHKVDFYCPSSRGERIMLMLEVWREKRAIKKWLKQNPDVVICYIPVEFDLEKDGVRSLDKDYQHDIEKIMRDTFDELIKEGYIKYGYKIMGSIDQREKQLREIITHCPIPGMC